MNTWTLNMNWTVVLFLLWFSTFTAAERVALGAAFLVLIGVIGEEIAEFKVLEGKEKERVKKAVKRFAIGFLLLGLAGDVVGIVMGQAEMAALTTEAGNAKNSADDAATKAKLAKDSADAANVAAGAAQKKSDFASIAAGKAQSSASQADKDAIGATTKAEAVGKQANELDQRLAATETKRAELEKSLINMAVCSAPRIIPGWVMTDASGKPTSVIDPLRPSAGRHVLVEFVPFDAEARRATLNLAGALESAGWIIDKVTTAEGIDDGVAILPYQVSHHIRPEQGAQEWEDHVQAMKAGDDLAEFLTSYDWQAVSRYPRKSETVDDIPHGGMKIEIGLYPAVQFVTPPGEKGFAESVARLEQAQQEEMKKLREQQDEKEEEAIKKLHLRPQEEAELRNRRKEEEAEEKVLVKRYSQPCQPVIGGGIISPTNP